MTEYITPCGFAVGTALEVESATKAIRVTRRPPDLVSLGIAGSAFSLAPTSGAIAAGIAANSTVFSFRWASGALVATIDRVWIQVSVLGTAFTAGLGIFEMFPARNFLVADTGGTTFANTTYGRKSGVRGARISAVNDFRIPTTAALGVVARTLDAQPVGNLVITVPITTTNAVLGAGLLWSREQDGEWPGVLGLLDGFIIRTTMPATGTWQITVAVKWNESRSY